MDKIKKVIVMALVIAVGSLGLAGCKDKEEHPTEHPSTTTPSEETPSGEQPTGEHPTGEHPN